MGRGLDGYFDIRSLALCSFEGPREAVPHPDGVLGRGGLDKFPVAIARGKHLFPFRTEPLSPSAPMVLGPQGPGRVGRRRFFYTDPACFCRWGFVFCGTLACAPVTLCRTRDSTAGVRMGLLGCWRLWGSPSTPVRGPRVRPGRRIAHSHRPRDARRV